MKAYVAAHLWNENHSFEYMTSLSKSSLHIREPLTLKKLKPGDKKMRMPNFITVDTSHAPIASKNTE